MATHRNISMDEREAVASVALKALATANSATTATNGTLGVASAVYYYDSDGNLITAQGGSAIVATNEAIEEAAAGIAQVEADYQAADAALQEAYEAAIAAQNEKIAALEEADAALETAVEDAQSVADGAQTAADAASTAASEAANTASEALESAEQTETLIRETDAGIEVAKLSDGEYTTTRTLVDDGGFYVIDNATDYTVSALTTSGVTFFDGAGQSTSNVTASFNDSGSVIGYQSAAHVTTSSAGIEVADGGGGVLDLSAGSMAFSDDGTAQATFGTSGVTISPSGVTAAALTTSAVSLYAGGTLGATVSSSGFKAYFPDGSTAGLAAGSSGLYIYDDDGTVRLATTSSGLNLYGSSSSSYPVAHVDSSYIAFGNGTSGNPSSAAYRTAYFGSSGVYLYGTTGSSYPRMIVNSSGIVLYDGTGTSTSDLLASFSSSGLSFYQGGTTMASFSGSGTTFYDESGSKQLSITSDSIVIGHSVTDGGCVYLEDGCVSVQFADWTNTDDYPFFIENQDDSYRLFRVSTVGNVGMRGRVWTYDAEGTDVVYDYTCSGTMSMTPTASTITRSSKITYSDSEGNTVVFASAPRVILQVRGSTSSSTTTSATINTIVAPAYVSESGFYVDMYRTSATATYVYWVAIGKIYVADE